MPENSPIPFGQRAKSALVAFLRVFARAVVILIGAALLGWLVYFGYVTVYKQAVLPARDNAERLSRLETSQAQAAPDLTTLQKQLAALEAQRRIDSFSLEAVKSDQAQLRSELDLQTVQLQRLDDLQSQLNNLRLTADQAFMLGAQAYQATVGKDALINSLERKIVLLKVTSLLNRSRLYMIQSNFGLARDQVVMARGMLSDLLESASQEQSAVLNQWIGRLDSALANLPGSPISAADNLEIAWGLILQGLPETIIPTPTPIYFNPDGNPPPNITYTPTPYFGQSVFPTNTPYITPTP